MSKSNNALNRSKSNARSTYGNTAEDAEEEEDEGQGQGDSGEDKSRQQSPVTDDPFEVRRLTSLHNSGNLDVDPDLVVHRFSQTAQSDNPPLEETGNEHNRPSGMTDEKYWENYEEGDGGDYSWRDSYDQSDEYYEHYDGQDEELDDITNTNLDDDTIRPSIDNGTEASESVGMDDSTDKQGTGNKAEIGKASFRWFERKILAQQIPQTDENMRRKRLLEKCQMLRKVSKPVVTLFGAKPKHMTSTASINQDLPKPRDSKLSSEASAHDEDFVQQETTGKNLPEFDEKAWAMKNTIDFLQTAGCTSSSGPTYSIRLKSAKEEAADFRLVLYEKQLQRRREAIGHSMQAPEITAALRRHAERAIWRAVIDNNKPRYPLPRFILPRHQYLRKVQEQFIGPGSYEHDVYEKQQNAKKLRLPSTWGGSCFSRFPREKVSAQGSRLLDPWTTLDKANYKKRYPGVYVPFESTPKNYRGKALTEGPGSRVPPNAYTLKSPMAEFIKKKTGLRGPYDCYTPSRNVIPYGYHQTFTSEEKCRLGPGSYEIRSSLVKEMNDSYNFFKGQFGKADRDSIFGFKAAFDKPLWPRKNVIIPPPGQYDVGKDVIGSDKKQNKVPFRTGMKNKEFFKAELSAPDYYYFASGATWTKPPGGANLASVFRSKTPQIMTRLMNQVRKTRNKAVNKKLDMEGGGHKFEVHYVPDESMKKDYVLEDCQNPCLMEKTGARKDLFAIPGHGIVGTGAATTASGKCCGG